MKDEIISSVIKASLNLIPYVGGYLSEFYNPLIKNLSQKRIDKFIENLHERLVNLEKCEKIQLQDLSNNEVFNTSLMQALPIATRIHQKEKLEALVNAVSKTAFPINMNEDLCYSFIEYINDLTPSHLKLLKFFSEKDLININSYEEIFIIFSGYSDLLTDRWKFKLFCDDLSKIGFLEFSDDITGFKANVKQQNFFSTGPGTEEIENLPMVILTEAGKFFLTMIENQKQNT